jgi:hypothetical protein
MMASTDLWGDLAYSDAFKFNDNGGVYQLRLIHKRRSTTRSLQILQKHVHCSAWMGNPQVRRRRMAVMQPNGSVLQCPQARGKLHLSEVNGSAYSDALAALNRGGFSSSADDAAVTFGTGATEITMVSIY